MNGTVTTKQAGAGATIGLGAIAAIITPLYTSLVDRVTALEQTRATVSQLADKADSEPVNTRLAILTDRVSDDEAALAAHVKEAAQKREDQRRALAASDGILRAERTRANNIILELIKNAEQEHDEDQRQIIELITKLQERDD